MVNLRKDVVALEAVTEARTSKPNRSLSCDFSKNPSISVLCGGACDHL